MKIPSPSAAAKGVVMWDAHAPVYEQVWERSTTLWGRDALVLGQLPSTAASPPPRFLDVACGAGALAVAAASMGFDVTATDYSPGMISRVKTKLASSPLQVTTLVTDGQTLERLEDNSFDVVSSNFGMAIFPDRGAAWRSAWRVLKPGGRLLVTSWDANSVNFRMIQYLLQNAADKTDAVATDRPSIMGASNRTLAAATFQQELEEEGFVDVRVHTVSHHMCFSSGEELMRGVLDNAGMRSMLSHKDPVSVACSVLDFAQLVLDGVDPSDETAVARSSTATAEDHALWTQSFALQAVGHIAMATKPSDM